jgi:hypothetical protein
MQDSFDKESVRIVSTLSTLSRFLLDQEKPRIIVPAHSISLYRCDRFHVGKK